MLLPLLVALLQTTAPPVAADQGEPASRDARPVRVWLGSGGLLTRGTPVHVYVQASQDGNLIVLHRRTDGRIEVLFPGSPKDDPYVRAGTYEIQATQDRAAFVVAEPDGSGLVLAALAPTAYRFDEFVRAAAWSPDALAPSWSGSDSEGVLSDIVQRMLGDGYFNYDIATYRVAPPVYAMQQDTGATLPTYPTCSDCTFIGVQENVFEAVTLCDAFLSPCVAGGRFRHHARSGGEPAAAPTRTIALSMRRSSGTPLIPRDGRTPGAFVRKAPSTGQPLQPRPRAPAVLPRERAGLPLRAIPLTSGRPAVAHAPAAPVVPFRRRTVSAPAEPAATQVVRLTLTPTAAREEPDAAPRSTGTITLTGLTVTPPAALAAMGNGSGGRGARRTRAPSEPPPTPQMEAAPRARALAVSGTGATSGAGEAVGTTGRTRGQSIALPPAMFHGAQARIPVGRAGARHR